MKDSIELLSLQELVELLKFSERHVRYRIITQPQFPEPIYLTNARRNARWRAEEVREWIAQKEAAAA